MTTLRLVGSALLLSSFVLACGAADDENTGDSTEMVVSGKSGFTGAYASPTIARDGATYHAYMAKQTIDGKQYHVPHGSFTATGKWTFHGEALPNLGKHAVPNGVVWAPAVAKIDDSHWMLYYTAQLEGTDQKKCIWRAHSSDPHGPFIDDYDGPIECRDASLWAIDPYLVQDAQGDWNLAARLDEPGGINTIQVRQLGPFAQNFAPGSDWKLLTHNASSSWEQPVLENAGLVRLKPPNGGKAHWFVFYSGRAWDDNSYAVGYADCGESIYGEDHGAGQPRCKKVTTTGPWLDTNQNQKLFGPGTPTFYDDESGQTMMSVQTWQFSGGKKNAKNNGQSMRSYAIGVDNDYAPHVVLRRVDL